MEIRQNDVLMAQGRLESCVMSLEKRMPLRLQAVDFPPGLAEDIPHGIPEFRKLKKDTEGMRMRYRRTVRVSDLDKSRNMTNLRYIEMFQDACDSAFWEVFRPKEMEIRFLRTSLCSGRGSSAAIISAGETGSRSCWTGRSTLRKFADGWIKAI